MHTDLEQAVIFFACLIVAVILHEVSHGVVASWFGDDTAKRAGRLTLNPIPHIDPVGSIVMPAMGAMRLRIICEKLASPTISTTVCSGLLWNGERTTTVTSGATWIMPACSASAASKASTCS